nr:formaldehyde dehydrogenase [Rhodococcus sp. JVH1]
MVLGHENLGIVAEVGNAVVKVSPGDRVCLPFNIGCGSAATARKG